MEIFLWLILLARFLWKSAPYILGLVVALFVFRYIEPGIPHGRTPLVFLAIVIGFICILKDTLSQK